MRTTDIDSIKAKYGIIGRDQRLYRALDTALQVARTDLSVLIQGESGVGKEVVPRIIHDFSPRKTKKYIAINCGSIPEGTIDSELFGHEKGSFTGAIGEHEGYFGAADGGTLFLDEVGELPLSTQARLLRVLETGEYIRVGSNQPRKTNVRIVAATNVNMQRAIREGKFREDLYFRLCTISIKMPPLRDRGNDVLLIFKKFCYDVAGRYNIPEPLRLSPEAEMVMTTYKWPGNIRQLRNLAEQMSILCNEQRTVTPAMLAEFDVHPGSESHDVASMDANGSSGSESLYERERPYLLTVIQKLEQNVKELQKQLAIMCQAPSLDDESTSLNRQHVLGLPDNTMLSVHPVSHTTQNTISSHAASGSDVASANAMPNVVSVTEQHSGHVVVADGDAELIEERSDLNLERMEKKMIEEALRRNHYRRKSAALELGISERTLYRKINDYGIEEK